MNKILSSGFAAALGAGILAANGADATVSGTFADNATSVYLNDIGVTPNGQTLVARMYKTGTVASHSGANLDVGPSSNTNAFSSWLDVMCFNKSAPGAPAIHITGSRINKTGQTAGDINGLACPTGAPGLGATGTINDL